MRHLHTIILLISAAAAAVSCTKDFKPTPVPTATTGVYILNSGNYNSNDASLVTYDPQTGTVSADIFSAANGKRLGDVANDMLVYGSKLYIAVTNSAVIFVTDLDGRIITEIKEGSPRHFCAEGGKVYATLYEGYAAEIDTASFSVKKVQTGPNPEGIAYSNGKLYVADSYGYDQSGTYGTTVTVIDRQTFTVTGKLTVLNNPQTFHAPDSRHLYLITWGNYADIPAALQKIDTSTDEVTTIPDVHPTVMALGWDSTAYLICSSYDADWNHTIKYYRFDLGTETVTGELTDTAQVPNGCCIAYDALTDLIYIGCSDYASNGDVCVMTSSGIITDQFDTGGMNPITLAFRR